MNKLTCKNCTMEKNKKVLYFLQIKFQLGGGGVISMRMEAIPNNNLFFALL